VLILSLANTPAGVAAAVKVALLNRMKSYSAFTDHVPQNRQQLSDPLLTVLTVMLAVFMFVVAPLQAAGILAAHQFGIAFGIVLIAAVFIVSESIAALLAVLIAVGLVVLATVLRLRHPSVADIYLDAGAWLILDITLGFVVARAVFAPGIVTSHRIVGAILLYLDIALVSLPCSALSPSSFRMRLTASGRCKTILT
jgi:hypothetical protein